jgi:transposase InsO family protein
LITCHTHEFNKRQIISQRLPLSKSLFAQSGVEQMREPDTCFTGLAMLRWAQSLRLDWHYIDPGKPFNGRLRDELLNETLFTSLTQARVELEAWRRDYNSERPHSALGNLTPIAYAARNASVPQQADLPSRRKFIASKRLIDKPIEEPSLHSSGSQQVPMHACSGTILKS